MSESEKLQKPATKHRILVIDDDADFLELLRFRFVKKNCEYHTANNGEEGLALAKTLIPELILVDIKMPRMNGYEFIRELKQDEKTRKIPVIVLTSFVMMRDMFGLEGVQDYIVKSADMSNLWTTVSRYLT